MNLKQSTALVTGGAVRIGRAICEALAARGCRLVVHYSKSAEEAAELAQRVAIGGGQAWTVQGALGTQSECESVFEQAWRLSGGLNILINNASVFHLDSLAASDESRLLEELRVNALAPILLTRAFARRIAAQDKGGGMRGKVVNLLDRRIGGTEKGCIPYLLSKKMLANFTEAAALELAPGISVNGVAPGAILPPRQYDGRPAVELAGDVPLQRQCTPQDVADAVVFLLESDAITGQILYVDGGQHLGK